MTADADQTSLSPRDLLTATRDLRMLGAMFKGLLTLAQKTEQIEKLLSAESEIQQRTENRRHEAEQLTASADAAQRSLDTAQRRLDGINAEIARHQAAMDAEHTRTIEAAHAEAKNIHAAGRTKAEEMLADARATAATEGERHAAEIRERQTTIADLDAEIATRRSELDGINRAIADLRAKIGVQ
jgi:chromosome segregation ATPase